jgi:hypothetical protein
MSDENSFLQRWSRKKRAANAEPIERQEGASAQPVAPEKEPFDIATLPPIESITELTDITAFLQQGVPAELARAALRRVWTADPAIRDFVGLAENAWDFTDPTAMPGFGPLESTEEVRRMVAEVIRQIGQAAQPGEPEAEARHAEVTENSNDSSVINTSGSVSEASPVGAPAAQTLGNQVMLQSNTEDNAVQHDLAEAQEKPQQLSRRAHGGALPE